MDLENWNLKWRKELADGRQTVHYQPGALFWGVNCLVISVSSQPILILTASSF